MKFRRLKKKEEREVRRVVEYLISGGAFFWTGYVAFFVFDKLLGSPLWLASTMSYVIGWTINYLLQRYWVFNNPRLKKHETEVTGRYIFISAVNIPINYFILWILKSAGITPYIGQFVSSGFFTVWNYAWYKLWVFPERFSRKTINTINKKTTTRRDKK